MSTPNRQRAFVQSNIRLQTTAQIGRAFESRWNASIGRQKAAIEALETLLEEILSLASGEMEVITRYSSADNPQEFGR